MALLSDAVMVIFCDALKDAADHDHWHSYEHMHERLSIPGFLRGTRWLRLEGSPRYLIVYEVANVEVAHSPAYLERLNSPTAWTAATMKQLGGMRRGFCRILATAGYGLGTSALCVRFSPMPGRDVQTSEWLAQVVAKIASQRGSASVHLFDPVAPPPMTREQAIRGRDSDMTSVILATGYDAGALRRTCDEHLNPGLLAGEGFEHLDSGSYALSFTATAAEVVRTPANPPRSPGYR